MATSDDASPRTAMSRREALARWENEGGLALPPSKPDEDKAVTADEARGKPVERSPI